MPGYLHGAWALGVCKSRAVRGPAGSKAVVRGWSCLMQILFLPLAGKLGLKHRPFLLLFRDGLSGVVAPPTQLLASLCLGAGYF